MKESAHMIPTNMFVKRKKGGLLAKKDWVVWISTIDKERPINEIIKAWEYSDIGLTLYRGIYKNFKKNKLAEIRESGRQNLYYAKFDKWMIEVMKESFNLEKIKNPEIKSWIGRLDLKRIYEFLNEKWVREQILTLENMLILFRGDNNLAKEEHGIFFIAPFDCVAIFLAERKLEELSENIQSQGDEFSIVHKFIESFRKELHKLLRVRITMNIRSDIPSFYDKIKPILKEHAEELEENYPFDQHFLTS
jgi:hypothetical protein